MKESGKQLTKNPVKSAQLSSMNFQKTLGAITVASATLLAVGAAQAATYTTQITGTDNATQFEPNHLEIVWSTSVSFGAAVDETSLSDLTISIYNDSNALIYSDVVISGGVVQPIGGLTRTLSEISFNATAGVSISSFDNDLNQLQLGSAVGTTFNIYGDASDRFNLAYYLNGTLQEDANLTNLAQNTTSAVPEPSSYAAVAGLVCAGIVATRRRRA